MTGPRPLEAEESERFGGAGFAWRDLADLWKRVYVLCLILYAPAALVAFAWLAWTGAGPMPLIAWAILMIPVGFGVAFVASIPLTLAWAAGAWAAGWHATQALPATPVRPCPRCGYDLSRFGGDQCPECGLERDQEDEREAEEG